jgi:hypothetical protein
MDPAFGNIPGMLAGGQPTGLNNIPGALGQGQMGNSFGALSGGQPMGVAPPSLSSMFGGNNTSAANPLQAFMQNAGGGQGDPNSSGGQFGQDNWHHWQSLISMLMQKLGVGAGGGGGGSGGMPGSQFLSPSNMGGRVPDMSGGLFGNSGALGGGTLAPTFNFSGIYSR